MSALGEMVKAAKEGWRNRMRLDVSGVITSDPQIGHTVRIRNLGTRPVVLKHWEIPAGRFPRRRHVESSASVYQGELHDDEIGPMGAKTLEFKELYYFPPRGRNLSIRLWLAGRKRALRYALP